MVTSLWKFITRAVLRVFLCVPATISLFSGRDMCFRASLDLQASIEVSSSPQLISALLFGGDAARLLGPIAQAPAEEDVSEEDSVVLSVDLGLSVVFGTFVVAGELSVVFLGAFVSVAFTVGSVLVGLGYKHRSQRLGY